MPSIVYSWPSGTSASNRNGSGSVMTNQMAPISAYSFALLLRPCTAHVAPAGINLVPARAARRNGSLKYARRAAKPVKRALPILAVVLACTLGAAHAEHRCPDGLGPVTKISDGSLACVSAGTAEVLAERGWGSAAAHAPSEVWEREVRLPDRAAADAPSEIGLTPQERAWLRDNPRIRVAVDPDWAPYEYLEDGGFAGLAAHYVPIFERMTGAEFVPAPAENWSDALASVRGGDDHVLMAATITDERKEYLGFTEPHTRLSWAMVTLAGSGFDAGSIGDYEVGTIRGYAIAEWLDERMPEIDYAAYDSEADAVGALASGEIDVLLQTWGVALASADEAGISVANAGTIGEQMRMAVAYPKGSELGPILQKAVAAVPPESREAIEARAVFDSRLTGAEKEWMERNGKVTVWYDPDWRPYEYLDDSGTLSGETRMYMDAFEDLTGLDFAQADSSSWKQSIDAQLEGGATALFMVGNTEQRREFLGFTTPHTYLTLNIITAERAHLGRGDLDGLRVGTMHEYGVEHWLDTNMPHIDYISHVGYDRAFEALKSGEIDALIKTWPVVSAYAARHGVEGLHNAGVLAEGAPISIGYPTGQPVLGSILQKALDTVPDYRKALFTAKATFDSGLTDAEAEWMSQGRTVRVAYDPDGPPFGYVDGDGRLAGFAEHYMEAVNYLAGVRFEPIETGSWAESLEAMRTGGADVAFALAETPGRAEYMGFTEPYATIPWNIVTTGSEELDAGDLESMRPGTIRGYAIEEWLDANAPAVRYTSYDSHAEALGALSSGEADAILDNWSIMASTPGAGDLALFNAGVVGEGLPFSIGYDADQEELGRLLERAVEAMPARLHEAILSKVAG